MPGFQREYHNTLETKLLMGGGKSLLLIQAAQQTESYRSILLTPCPPAWGVVVCVGATFVAPAAGAVAPVPAEADYYSLFNFNHYGY